MAPGGRFGIYQTCLNTITFNKLNENLSLFLNKHHHIKTYGGVEEYLHAFLTSARDGVEWSVSR
jgi:hypothetical protein